MPAGVALLYKFHMAAEGGSAAVANRFEGFSLMSAKHMSPSGKEIAFIFAENIGHFEPMFPHRFGSSMALAARTRSSVPSSSSGLLVELTTVLAT